MQPDSVPETSRWRRFGVSDTFAHRATRELVAGLGDGRRLESMVEVSANVSTNRVFLLRFDDGSHRFAKVSSYGSWFLFREDHDRVLRLINGLQGTRFERFLAAPVTVPTTDGSPPRLHTYYDGQVWGVLYEEVERRQTLPPILHTGDIECLAREKATIHQTCATVTARDAIPRTSTSLISDILHLLDLVSDRQASRTLRLGSEALDVVRRHINRFLHALEDLGYADMPRVPVLVDWNLGNFSVDRRDDGTFTLFSRWDYDWFRTEITLLDFYFLSRVSSETGDRSTFTYGVHTLAEPGFLRFLAAYREIIPLTERDVEMIVETYRFFLLHNVLSMGDHFFRQDLWAAFRQQAIATGLPSIDTFDRSPLRNAVRA